MLAIFAGPLQSACAASMYPTLVIVMFIRLCKNVSVLKNDGSGEE